MTMTAAAKDSVDAAEIAKFAAMAEEWWNENGKFKPLHRLNPVRIGYIRDRIAAHAGRDPLEDLPLKGLSILDIGCGGGLLCEPLARLGADVTGIDAGGKNIGVAALHAEGEGLAIRYRHVRAEALLAEKKRFDAVLAMEVIEHVADVDAFVETACGLTKPGGMLFISTLNRTAKSFTLAIVGAEYVCRWLPRGTHDWRRFLKPSEIERRLRAHGLTLKDLCGVTYSQLRDLWRTSRDVGVNYMMLAVKRPE